MTNGPRFRFAPSPTGSFHVGGARTALHNWALARRLGGTLVLRIEDTDEARNRPEWTEGIIDALAWIGISADDPHFEGPIFQSAYADAHVAAAQRLYEAGAAYYCDLTGEQVQQRAKELGTTGYDGYSRDRGLEPGPGRVLRFRVPDGSTVVCDAVRGEVEFDNSTIEDFVLVRGNGTPMFLLANVVDDMSMEITDVVRAEEHLPNTPKQQMLWEALGHEPPRWAHVPVLVNEQRKKLSKRRDKVALESYRDDGILANAMVNYLMTLGWTPPGAEEAGSEIFSWADLEAAFRLEDVNRSPAFFDEKKLIAFNKAYIRDLPLDEFVDRAGAELPDDWDRERFRAIAPHIQERLERLSDAAGAVDFLFVGDGVDPELDEASWTKAMTPEWSSSLLGDVTAAYESLPAERWDADTLKVTIEDIMGRFTTETGGAVKLGKAQAPVRVAVTGRSVGPPLFESLEVLGQAESVRRLRAAVTRADEPTAPD
ncbi:MAG: glutamate--tRNA ligase [Actinomycetota bacterium]